MIVLFLKKLPWQRFLKFLITGGMALLIDVTLYFLLTRFGGLYYLLARTLSLGVAIVWSFQLNRHWTFQATEGNVRTQAVKFLVVIISTSLLSLGLMHIGVALLHFYDLLVLFVVSVLITLLNFSAHSLWSYATIKNKEPPVA